MFTDLGNQRMMAMEMILAVNQIDIDSDSVVARIRLEEAGEEFERILGAFVGNVERLNFLVRPEMKAATQATAEFWDEVVPQVRTVLETGATTAENADARDYIRIAGPRLAELTTEMARSLGLQMETTRQRLWYFLVGVVAFNLLLVVSGYLLIRHRIVKPLRRLEQAALTLRSGRLEARVESGYNNEIGLVERAFNDMAREIEVLVASLEERRIFAESLITHAPVGVVVHREGGLLFANPHFLSLIEAPSIEAVDARDFNELFPPMERASVAPDTSSPTARELRLRVKGEGTRKVEAVTVRIEHESREAAMTILQDVTERDELSARMMQIDRVAALGTLLAGMGHEINNPLSYLANNLEFSLAHLEQLRREISDNRESGLPLQWEERCEAVVEALRESTLGSQRIRDIVSRLREFSRVDDTPRKAIQLEGVLESSIRMADSEIRHRARLVRDFRSVPSVEANESQIAQVFLNLLINAAHALDEGNSERDSITVSLFSQDDQVIVEVADTGSGIPKEAASRIFDPFFTTKPPGQGTGLGLSICQRIVEAHGGLLTFRTNEGEGTTFRVSLKAVEQPEDVASTPELSRPQVGRRKLAIIDDDPMVCRGLKRLLENENEVHVSTDAQTFLDALDRGESYDVVFCDLMMPGMTGMELHDILAVRYPEILARTVFMTGGAFTPQAERFLETLRYPLLLKPFDLDQIRDLVARTEARTS